MLQDSVIEPVEKVTDWCSGWTAAPKSDGKVRMCVGSVGITTIILYMIML